MKKRGVALWFWPRPVCLFSFWQSVNRHPVLLSSWICLYLPSFLASTLGACCTTRTSSMLAFQWQRRGGHRQEDPARPQRAWLGRAWLSCRSHVSPPPGCVTEKREQGRGKKREYRNSQFESRQSPSLQWCPFWKESLLLIEVSVRPQ